MRPVSYTHLDVYKRQGAILYLRVYFLGMPALALYNFGNAVFSEMCIRDRSELNFCVRHGNRWNLTVIVTDQYDWFSITFLFYVVQCFLKDVPSKLNNHC